MLLGQVILVVGGTAPGLLQPVSAEMYYRLAVWRVA
jgi:hypothetical protein